MPLVQIPPTVGPEVSRGADCCAAVAIASESDAMTRLSVPRQPISRPLRGFTRAFAVVFIASACGSGASFPETEVAQTSSAPALAVSSTTHASTTSAVGTTVVETSIALTTMSTSMTTTEPPVLGPCEAVSTESVERELNIVVADVIEEDGRCMWRTQGFEAGDGSFSLAVDRTDVQDRHTRFLALLGGDQFPIGALGSGATWYRSSGGAVGTVVVIDEVFYSASVAGAGLVSSTGFAGEMAALIGEAAGRTGLAARSTPSSAREHFGITAEVFEANWIAVREAFDDAGTVDGALTDFSADDAGFRGEIDGVDGVLGGAVDENGFVTEAWIDLDVVTAGDGVGGQALIAMLHLTGVIEPVLTVRAAALDGTIFPWDPTGIRSVRAGKFFYSFEPLEPGVVRFTVTGA